MSATFYSSIWFTLAIACQFFGFVATFVLSMDLMHRKPTSPDGGVIIGAIFLVPIALLVSALCFALLAGRTLP